MNGEHRPSMAVCVETRTQIQGTGYWKIDCSCGAEFRGSKPSAARRERENHMGAERPKRSKPQLESFTGIDWKHL